MLNARLTCILMCWIALWASPLARAAVTDSQHTDIASVSVNRDTALGVMQQAELLKPDTPPSNVQQAFANPAWGLIPSGALRIGPQEGPRWLRIALHNTDSQALRFRLDTDLPALKTFDVWRAGVSGEGFLHVASSRQNEPYSDRPLNHHTLATELTLDADEQALVVIRVDHHLPRTLAIRLLSPQSAKREDRFDAAISGGFHAVMLGILLLTLAGRKLIGTALCVIFVLYLASSQLFILSWEQHIYRFVLPDNRPLDLRLWGALLNAVLATQLLFGRSLFALDTLHPRYAFALLVLAVANAAVFALELLPVPTVREAIAILDLPRTLGSLVLHFVTAILALRAGRAGAIAFVMTGGFIIAVAALRLGGLIEAESMLSAMRILFLAEATAFTAALLRRTSGLMRERDRARAAEMQAKQRELETATALNANERAYAETRLMAERYASRLASVSHDIAQPLAALRMTLGREESAHSSVIESLNYLEQLTQHNALPSSTQANTHADSIELGGLCEQVIAMFESEALAAGCTLSFSERPDCANADVNGLALMRVLSNLVSNAIRHADAEQVTIGLYHEAGRYRIVIEDNGVGLDGDTQAQIMQPRVRASDAPGQGLGLSIVQDNCRDQRFTFTLDSSPGGGTRASVEFNARPCVIADSTETNQREN